MTFYVLKKPSDHFPREQGSLFSTTHYMYEWVAGDIVSGVIHHFANLKDYVSSGYLIEIPPDRNPYDYLEEKGLLETDTEKEISKNYNI